MAFDYGAMRSMAVNLLSEFGSRFTLMKLNDSVTYNKETKKSEPSFTSCTGVCVMKTYTAEMIGSLSNIIQAGDVSFVCAMDDISIVPSEGKDKVVFGGKTYNILEAATSDPSGGKVIVHTLHCRRAV